MGIFIQTLSLIRCRKMPPSTTLTHYQPKNTRRKQKSHRHQKVVGLFRHLRSLALSFSNLSSRSPLMQDEQASTAPTSKGWWIFPGLLSSTWGVLFPGGSISPIVLTRGLESLRLPTNFRLLVLSLLGMMTHRHHLRRASMSRCQLTGQYSLVAPKTFRPTYGIQETRYHTRTSVRSPLSGSLQICEGSTIIVPHSMFTQNCRQNQSTSEIQARQAP